LGGSLVDVCFCLLLASDLYGRQPNGKKVLNENLNKDDKKDDGQQGSLHDDLGCLRKSVLSYVLAVIRQYVRGLCEPIRIICPRLQPAGSLCRKCAGRLRLG
jgi:hypothetical protein